MARYTIVLDGRTVGQLEQAKTLKVAVGLGEHTICARSGLNFSPAKTFTVAADPTNIECGFLLGRRVATFAVTRAMRHVHFRMQ